MGLYNNRWKPARIFVAAVLVFASLVPILNQQDVSAAQITERSIQMSSSANGATDVTYSVTFTPETTDSTAGLGIVIDFCGNSPIIEATCTTGSGTSLENFDTNEDNLAIDSQTGFTAGSIAVDTTNSTTSTIILTSADATTTSGNEITIVLGSSGGSDGITNPSTTNDTFYARIITYATSGDAQSYASTSVGSPVDSGGVALSTAEQLIVTAKVPERLSFCVYVDTSQTPTNDCTTKTGSAIKLGDDDGALHTTGEFINKDAFFSISTNAGGCSGGADCTVVNIKGDTLTSGSDTIDAMPNGGGEGTQSAINQEQFGFCIYESDGSGLTPDALYDGNDGATGDCSALTHNSDTNTTGQAPDGLTFFALDTAATTSTYGDSIATKNIGDYSTANLAFVGNIGAATPAGVYTSTLTFIATGTY